MFEISLCLIYSYIKLQVIGPLANDTITWMAMIGHLELEDVISTRSVSILIEQNTCTCTSCRKKEWKLILKQNTDELFPVCDMCFIIAVPL